jgi:hypothetical protein
MKLIVGHLFACILTFLLGVTLAELVSSSDRSRDLPRQERATLAPTASSQLETEPRGHRFGAASSVPLVQERRPTIDEFKKLVTCKDKTISVVWDQLTRTKEFWDWMNPSYENHDCSGMFEASKYDLNDDGLKEIRIRGQYGNHCGATGNCEEWVFGYDKARKRYKLLLTSSGEYFYVRKDTANGYKNIYITTHDSASSSYHLVYKFSGGHYKESKCWIEEYSIDGSRDSTSCAEKNRQYEIESSSQ